MNGLNLSQLNRAITHGADAGTFLLPKGPSGKIKLAPKSKPAASKEVCHNTLSKSLIVSELLFLEYQACEP